ncbi:MAG: MFS transporter [Slackia sp.]
MTSSTATGMVDGGRVYGVTSCRHGNSVRMAAVDACRAWWRFPASAPASSCPCRPAHPDMFIFFVILTGISGVIEAFFNGPLLAVLQKRIPPEKMGRVMGLFTTVSALSSPIGLALAGTCAEFTGVANWFIIAGIVVSVGGILLGTLPILRKLDKEIAHV